MAEKKAISEKLFFHFFIAALIFWVFCFVTRLNIKKNRHRINHWPNGIFVANHQQFFDLVWIPFSLRLLRPRKEKLYVAVNRGNFESSFAWNFLNWFFPVIFIDSGERKVLDTFQQKLDEGHSVFMFPEGTFNLFGHTLLPFYHGATNLAVKKGFPLYPLALENRKMFSIFPFPLKIIEQLETIFFFLFRKTTLSVGKPVLPLPTEDFSEIKRITHECEKEIAGLAGLRPFHFSERVRRLKADPTDIDEKWILRAGISHGEGFSIHWRTMAILEKIHALHMEESLDIQIGDNVEIKDKVYLFPHSKVFDNELVQVEIRGVHKKLHLWN